MPILHTPAARVVSGGTIIIGRSGRQVMVRALRPGDDVLLIEFYHRLSSETRRTRFFAAPPNKPAEVVMREACLRTLGDPRCGVALVGVVRQDHAEQIVALANYGCEPDCLTSAELALVVQDDYQHDGFGSALLKLLLNIAAARGVRHMRAVTLAENLHIQHLLHATGLPITSETRRGETTMLLTLPDRRR